jgi:hypothetical protein
LLFVRFLPVLPLALPAAVFDHPTLSAFEEFLIECLFEHVAIGTHFSLSEIGCGFEILFGPFQKDFGHFLVAVGNCVVGKVIAMKALPPCFFWFLVQSFPSSHEIEHPVDVIYRWSGCWALAATDIDSIITASARRTNEAISRSHGTGDKQWRNLVRKFTAGANSINDMVAPGVTDISPEIIRLKARRTRVSQDPSFWRTSLALELLWFSCKSLTGQW